MGFQTTVNLDPAIGVAGQEVNPHQAVYTAFNFVSDGTVKAGGFAFARALEGDAENEMNFASATGDAGSLPLGLVERNQIAQIVDPLADHIAVYPEGSVPPIAIRGQFYATATGEATEGQSVLCDPETGEVTYGSSGDTNDTGWVVRLPQGVSSVAEGDLVIYENFGANP